MWEDAYRELVLSPIALITPALRGMRERGFGRILGVTSSSAREPIPGLMLSTAHRGGLTAAFKQLAREVARDGVTVNTLQPGRVATNRLAETYGSLEVAEEAGSRSPSEHGFAEAPGSAGCAHRCLTPTPSAPSARAPGPARAPRPRSSPGGR